MLKTEKKLGRQEKAKGVTELVNCDAMKIVNVLPLLKVVLKRPAIGIPEEGGIKKIVRFFHNRATVVIDGDSDR